MPRYRLCMQLKIVKLEAMHQTRITWTTKEIMFRNPFLQNAWICVSAKNTILKEKSFTSSQGSAWHQPREISLGMQSPSLTIQLRTTVLATLICQKEHQCSLISTHRKPHVFRTKVIAAPIATMLTTMVAVKTVLHQILTYSVQFCAHFLSSSMTIMMQIFSPKRETSQCRINCKSRIKIVPLLCQHFTDVYSLVPKMQK